MTNLSLRKFLHQTSVLAAGTLGGMFFIGTNGAHADDFVINTPVVVTNGGNVINGDDSLTITANGSITTAGHDGVNATGTNNTITNNGSIATTGNVAEGIRVDDNNTITNTGSVTTTGDDAEGILADDNNTITNTGSVTTTGEDAVGILVNNDNTINNSGSITTSGQFAEGIEADNNNTVTNSGSITASGQHAEAIEVRSNNNISNSGSITTTGLGAEGIIGRNGNTVSNSGSITTMRDDSDGIDVDDNNTITNTGSITTSGRFAEGIFAGNANTITNSGSVSTAGPVSAAIDVIDGNIISNSGSVSTTGSNSVAIEVRNNNNISNSGSISTTGVGADGIHAGTSNTITNSGSISTTGDFAEGIFAGNNNIISNSGSVTTTGDDAEGIRAADNNTITNAGLVVSALDDAIQFDTNNTLNLNAPSFIGGTFNLGVNTTLSITTGASHSILWTFDTTQLNGGAPTIAGLVPVFQQTVGTTLQVATFDPTTFAASSDALAQLSGSLSGLMQQRLESNGTLQSVSNLNAYVATAESKTSGRINRAFDEASSTSAPGDIDAPAAWLSVFGSSSRYDATNATTNYNLGQWGIAGGYDWSPSADLKIGIMGGYAQNRLDANSRFANTYDNDTSGFFIGFYGRKDLGATFVDFVLSGGVTQTNQDRLVNDNLAALGVSVATSDYGSFWVSPEIAIGTRFDLANGWVASPSARLRYASQWFDGYSETGPSAANAVVGSRQVSIGEVKLEFAAMKYTERGSTTLRAGYLFRNSFGGDATVTLIGQTQSIASFVTDRSAGYAGITKKLHLNNTLDLEFGGRAVFGDGILGAEGNVKLVATF